MQKSLSLGFFLALLIELYKGVFWTSLRTSSGRRQDMPLGVKHQTVWGHPHNVCRRRPQDDGRGSPMTLHIGQYGDVLRTLHWDVLRTSYFNVLRMSGEDVLRRSVGDVLWRYIVGLMGTSIGRLLGMSPGCL